MDALEDDQIPCLLEKLMNGKDITEDEIESTVTKLIQSCHAPHLNRAEDVPYERSDFLGVACTAKRRLDILSRILEELNNSQNKGKKFSLLFKKSVVIRSFLVASEYSEKEWEWSSEEAALSARNVIQILCQFASVLSLKKLLCGEPEDSDSCAINYLECALQTLTSTFNKKSWKKCVAARASYWFILFNLDEKCLGSYLTYLLPPALFIVDDWEQRNKIFGLKCLHHILQNTTGAEIRWYGRGTVIYEAIKNLLHSREVKVLEALYPTLILVAGVLESDPEYTGQLRSVSTNDTIMQQLIQEMRHEQNIALRITYSAALPDLLNAMGILSLKWSVEIVPMFEDYLATYSGPKSEDRINILKGMQVYIQKCWPQIHANATSILEMILRLLYDVTSQESDLDDQIRQNLVKEALQVVSLLHAAAPKTTQKLCEDLASVEVHPQCQCLLREVEKIVSP